MPLNPAFPISPYVILDPEIRWYPGDQQGRQRSAD
jgi:hypothetical protein